MCRYQGYDVRHIEAEGQGVSMGVSTQGFTPLAALLVYCIPYMNGPLIPCMAGAGRGAQCLDDKYLVHAPRETPLPPYHILKRTGSRLSRAACRSSRLGSAATCGALAC